MDPRQDELTESVTPVASDALLSRWDETVYLEDDKKGRSDSWEATLYLDFDLPISGGILGEITITGWGSTSSGAIKSLDESLEYLKSNLLDRFSRDNDQSEAPNE